MSVYGKQYSYNGEAHYLSEWSKITGIALCTLRKRIVDYKWDMGRALSEKPKRRQVNGYSYAQLSRMSPIGISQGTVRHRIVEQHMNIHDALTTPSYREGHTTNAIKKDRMAKDCCYPNCDNCPYDDCKS